jgi:hypothetical protein
MDSVGNSKPRHSWLLPVVILIAIIGLLLAIAIPNFVRGGSTKLLGIIHHLQQIDAAKQQWALEHGLTNTTSLNRVVTEKDLASYLLPAYTQKQEFGNPAFGELYLIRDLNQSPEAVLTRTLTERYTDFSLPKGTVIRLDRGTGNEWCYECYEIILPDGSSKIYRWINGSLTITNG